MKCFFCQDKEIDPEEGYVMGFPSCGCAWVCMSGNAKYCAQRLHDAVKEMGLDAVSKLRNEQINFIKK